MKKIVSLATILMLAACANNNPNQASNNTHHQATHTNTHSHTHNHQNNHSASSAVQRTFVCTNGFTIHTNQPSQTLTLNVMHGEPNPATVVLNHTGNGNYVNHAGLFGNGTQWSENGNGSSARLSYTTPAGRNVSMTCSR